jgi:hypothetical protein
MALKACDFLLQDLHFITKIKMKSGMDTPQLSSSKCPLEDLIIHLCIKDAVTCRNVIEVSRLFICLFNILTRG